MSRNKMIINKVKMLISGKNAAPKIKTEFHKLSNKNSKIKNHF